MVCFQGLEIVLTFTVDVKMTQMGKIFAVSAKS